MPHEWGKLFIYTFVKIHTHTHTHMYTTVIYRIVLSVDSVAN